MAAKSMLPATWQVADALRNRLGQRVGRQRAMIDGGQLLLVLHRPPKPDEDEREARFFWRQADGTWSSSHQGSGLAALNKHLDEYGQLIEQHDRKLDASRTSRDLFEVLEHVTPLHRAVRHLHQVLQEARQGLPQARELIDARDRAYELERRADLLHADAGSTLQFVQSQRAEEQAADHRRMTTYAHRLNTLAAFFLPLATLAAVLGSGLDHGLNRLGSPWALLVLVGTGLTLGLALQLLMNRRL